VARESPRILVVDDDDSVIGVMQQHFATAGCRVELAQHGGDALTLVQQSVVDAVATREGAAATI
jgi:CheY-like chemotaxis protein